MLPFFFFQVFKGKQKFEWSSKCEKAFQALKYHLGKVPLLAKPKNREKLLLYLIVSRVAASSLLIKVEGHNITSLLHKYNPVKSRDEIFGHGSCLNYSVAKVATLFWKP